MVYNALRRKWLHTQSQVKKYGQIGAYKIRFKMLIFNTFVLNNYYVLERGHKSHTVAEAMLKLEHFCSYQERCHDEVVAKLRALSMIPEAIDMIIVHLLDQNFLNEERFARSFARGKHRIKYWGRIRIVNELKQRHITQYNIKAGLSEISDDEYASTFDALSERHWNSLRESNTLKKRKKFCDFMLRKGYESDLIYSKVKALEQL